jgi:hypothetical protein
VDTAMPSSRRFSVIGPTPSFRPTAPGVYEPSLPDALSSTTSSFGHKPRCSTQIGPNRPESAGIQRPLRKRDASPDFGMTLDENRCIGCEAERFLWTRKLGFESLPAASSPLSRSVTLVTCFLSPL